MLLLIGGVASFVPAPEALRLLVVSVATTLVARRITAAARMQELATQSA